MSGGQARSLVLGGDRLPGLHLVPAELIYNLQNRRTAPTESESGKVEGCVVDNAVFHLSTWFFLQKGERETLATIKCYHWPNIVFASR